MARRDPVGIRLITRRGNDWTQRYPLVAAAVNHLKVRSCLIDGEVESRPQESAQGDKWSFCLTAGTLCPSNQEKP
jgi:hypothetical protein